MGRVLHPCITGRGIPPLQRPSYQRPHQSQSLIPGVSTISRERITGSRGISNTSALGLYRRSRLPTPRPPLARGAGHAGARPSAAYPPASQSRTAWGGNVKPRGKNLSARSRKLSLERTRHTITHRTMSEGYARKLKGVLVRSLPPRVQAVPRHGRYPSAGRCACSVVDAAPQDGHD